jgi:hypothetical protein
MNEESLRKRLPIGSHEKILKTVRHHWFAYVSVYIGTAFIIAVIFAVIAIINLNKNDLQISGAMSSAITFVGLIFAVIVGLFSLIPAWLKKQEYMVLTEEAIMQANKPSLFTNKVSQLNLVHISDVTVNQDTLGTLLGYGKIVIETPGEQDNYIFTVIPDPRGVAKAIIEAHENYAAALESGQIQTTLGQRPPVVGSAWRPDPPVQPQVQQSQAPVQNNDHSQAKSALGHIASEEAEEN